MWDKLDFPYFRYGPDPIVGHKFNEMNSISEDMYWCAQMHKKGVKVWVDPKIQCGHIGILEADRTLYEGAFNVAKRNYSEKPDGDPDKEKFIKALTHAD